MPDHIEFSVIIPTRDRPVQLEACLRALADLDYPRSAFEVVVVDDGSATPLEQIAEPFKSTLRLTLARQSAAGPAAARNCGAGLAKGRFLAFTDDDCAPAPDWLARFAERLSDCHYQILGGRAVNALTDNAFAAASQALLGHLYEYYNRDGSVRFFASCNLVIAAEVFRSLGGFGTGFPLAAAEDRDLCDRALSGGIRMTYAPEAVVFHTHALSWISFWNQHFGYGRGAYRFHRKRRLRTGKQMRVEPVRFYTQMLSYPFRDNRIKRPFAAAALLIAAQAANAAGFFFEALQPVPAATLDE